jgi:hypothetical protein
VCTCAGAATSAPGQAYEASATYQRVMTLLSPEQLQLVLAKGWEALDHSPVFSTDAGVHRVTDGFISRFVCSLDCLSLVGSF